MGDIIPPESPVDANENPDARANSVEIWRLRYGANIPMTEHDLAYIVEDEDSLRFCRRLEQSKSRAAIRH